MAIKLRTRSVKAEAPQQLCFEVVAAAGRKVEEVPENEHIVEFKTDYRGREVVTVERLNLTPPTRIDYEWLNGPLPRVSESISFESDASEATRITYQGTFDVKGGPIARFFARLWIKPSFDRIVLEHLEDAKRIAERRAQRSHVHPRREDTDNSSISGGAAHE